MIYLLTEKATKSQIETILEQYGSMSKIAVDIHRKVIAGGGEMHADCEQLLTSDGSEQG